MPHDDTNNRKLFRPHLNNFGKRAYSQHKFKNVDAVGQTDPIQHLVFEISHFSHFYWHVGTRIVDCEMK